MNLTTIDMDGERCGVLTTDNGHLQLFNSKLDVIKSRNIEPDYPVTTISSDFNYDGSTEIILISENLIRIFNNKLVQLSEFILSESPISIENHITINQSYKNNEAGIALNMPSGFKYYVIKENLDYVLLPVYIVLIFAGLFMLAYFSLGGYNQYQLFLKRRQLIRADHAFALFTIGGELIERSTKFRLTANVNSLKELLRVIGINLSVENFVGELTDEEISRVYTLNKNEIKIILAKDERVFHEPVIYVFITDKKSINSNERELWSKSIQKIAHDIKTPISSLLLNLKAIGLRLDKVEFTGKEDFVSDIEAMKEELSRVNNLTRGFLRFTNIEEPKLKITNLYELIKNVSKTFSHYTNNGIVIDVDIEKEIYVNADDYQLREVFQALIENAIEAMNHNGTVSISAEEIDGMHESASSEIMISVADHGEGMCTDTINKIFETTFSSKTTGNGLGLPIAKRIIELHHGKIEVYSREGIGTIFKLFLPSNR
ncbi:MAG: HAMP domain-containing sensor histidine kinase [Melioribacteraceae bacterium]|nr:HAMP domain-containing sensor histidine kinase [Melioribacteraceae bacterium]